MCAVGILFTSEGMMEHETERRIGRCIGRGEERAEPKGEALNLLVSLCSYPHLWSWTLGRDRKNKIPDTSGWNEFPLQGGGALPCSARRHKQGNSNMELDKITFTDTHDWESLRINWEKLSVQLLSETIELHYRPSGSDPNERDNNSCVSYSSDLNLTGVTFQWRIIHRPAPAAPFDPGCLQTWFVGFSQTVGASSNKWHLASRVTFTLMEWSCFGLENGNGSGGGNLGV